MRNNIKGVKKEKKNHKTNFFFLFLHLRLIPTYVHICVYIHAAPYNIVQK